MDNTGLLKSALKIVDELNELMLRCSEDDYNLSNLEIDLLKEKTRHTYDLLLKLASSSIEQDKPEVQGLEYVETEKESPEPEIVVEEKNSEKTGIEQKIDSNEPIESEPEAELNILSEDDAEIIEKSEIDTVNNEELISDKQKTDGQETLDDFDLFSGASIGDKFEEKKTVVEKISEEKKTESVGDKIQQDKISELKSAIGINEKFFFINELFDGDMKNYNEAIEKLDTVARLEEGFLLLKELREENDWKEDNDAYLQLSGFVNRKFK